MSGRPAVLFPLFAGLQTLDGIGPKTALILEGVGVEKPRDVLMTLPQNGVDRQVRDSVRDVVPPATATVKVTVGPHYPPKTRGRPYRVHVTDAQMEFQLVFFHAKAPYLQKILPTGQQRLISGKVETFDGVAQMVHPDHIVSLDEADSFPSFEPVYPLHAGITQKLMWKATRSALEKAPEVTEWIDPALVDKEGWPTWGDAMERVHNPKAVNDLSVEHPARRRLAYDELFAHQITLALARSASLKAKGRVTQATGALSA